MRTLVVLALLSVSAPALAQDVQLQLPRPRQGYWLGAALRMDGSYIVENGDSLGVWNGGGGGLRLGEMLTPALGVGLVFDFSGTSNKKETASLIGIMLEGQWEIIEDLSLRGGGG